MLQLVIDGLWYVAESGGYLASYPTWPMPMIAIQSIVLDKILTVCNGSYMAMLLLNYIRTCLQVPMS